jgi:RimJ/RimL family protein N-acetyltransferase
MIELEFFTEKDFDQLIGWVNREELMLNWTGSMFSFPLTREKLKWYIEDSNDLATSDVFIYKAVDTALNKAIGHISLGGISRKNRSGRISRVLVANECRKGRGVCQAMIQELLRIGFEELQLHRISLGVYDFNKAAINCYKRCGFRCEGLSRDVYKHGDEYWSLMEMSILEDEWRALYSKKAA